MTKYSSVVRWSDEDEVYIAVCPELGGISAFGDTPAEAIQEMEVAMELAIETYKDQGWPLPAPAVVQIYSGQFRLRLPRSLHRAAAEYAEAEGVSLNSLGISFFAHGLGLATAGERIADTARHYRETEPAQTRRRA